MKTWANPIKRKLFWENIYCLMKMFELCVGPNRSVPPDRVCKQTNFTMVESWKMVASLKFWKSEHWKMSIPKFQTISKSYYLNLLFGKSYRLWIFCFLCVQIDRVKKSFKWWILDMSWKYENWVVDSWYFLEIWKWNKWESRSMKT